MLKGKYHDQFQVDWYQGGAGTSTNMNANEVLANIALELTGHKKGDYHIVEPHDHLNMSQSTNDSYPTAIKVAFILRNDKLIAELAAAGRLVPRQGRRVHRHRQDGPHRAAGRGADDRGAGIPCVRGVARERDRRPARGGKAPLRRQHGRHRDRVGHQRARGLFGEGGGAPGEAHRASRLCRRPTCSRRPGTSRGSWPTPRALKSVAIKLSKIASDLILLASGPRAGLAEINLPALQPGSSIMPGKVNPVIPELVNLVAFRVMGNDYTVTLAAHSGQLQLNAYEPIEGLAVMESQHLLFNTSKTLAHAVHRRHHRQRARARRTTWNTTVGIVTALNPVLGLREGDRAGERGLQERQGHPRDHPREEAADGSADRGPARPGEADEAGQEHLPETRRSEADQVEESIMERVSQEIDLGGRHGAGHERTPRLRAGEEAEHHDSRHRRHHRRRRRDRHAVGLHVRRRDDRRDGRGRARASPSSPPSRASRSRTSARRT